MRSEQYEIYRSVPKLLVVSAITLGFSAALGFLAAGRYIDRAAVPLDHTFYWISGLAGFAVLLFLIRILPLWREVSRPAVVVSRDGISVRGKRPIAWGDIVSNDWNTLSVAFIPAGATLIVKGRGAGASCEAGTLRGKADAYFAACARFQSARAACAIRPCPSRGSSPPSPLF